VRPRPILLLALAAGLLPAAGCGDSQPPVPTGPVGPSAKTVRHDFPRAGMKLRLPSNLQMERQARLPAVFRAGLIQPFVAAFAYRRAEQVPRNERELADARRRLVRVTQGRDKGYKLIRSRTTEVDGARAVELLGEQTLGRTRLRIRSMHVYRGRAEYVIEVAAPRAEFARFDRGVTPVIERTLDVTGRVARR
jgi:hypothetical protein